MLKKDQFNQFYKSIIKNARSLKKQIKYIQFIKVLDKMGFPKNYCFYNFFSQLSMYSVILIF